MMGLTFIPVILSKTFPCSDIICSLGEVLCGGLSLQGGPEWPLCEVVEVRPGFLGDSEMLGMPESWGTCRGELRIGCGTGPRERRSEEHLTSDTENAECGVCPAGPRSCFGPVFPPCAPFPMFWKGNVYLCHYMWEACGKRRRKAVWGTDNTPDTTLQKGFLQP